jgi:SsrA-binding protein
MKILASNKNAQKNYEFVDRFIAGIILEGWEVKSIKSGKVSIDGAYAYIRDEEVFAKKIIVFPLFTVGKVEEERTQRDRKLLLNKNEIRKLIISLKNVGYTLVVTKVLLSDNNLIKVEIAVARGLKKYDKRAKKKEKDLKRKLDIERKYYG